MNRRLRRLATLAALAVLTVTLPFAQAQAACTGQFRGVNLVPFPTGWYNGAVESQFPTASHIAYYKNVGMNAIRLPLSWEELQPSLGGELNARYLAHVREFLDLAQTQGMKVLIDVHNYARYRNSVIGGTAVPSSAFTDLWKRLATALKSHPAVFAYGLMNEPHDTNGLWHSVAQAGVDGVRAADTSRLIYVSGDNWSNSQTWPTVNPKPFVTDPSNKIVYEAHIYFDDDFSGRYKTAIGSTDVAARAAQRLQPFLTWLKTHGQRGAIGEVGVPKDDSRWLLALTKFLDMSDAVCLNWFMWAGGAWKQDYELSLEPINGQDRPQIQLIRSRM